MIQHIHRHLASLFLSVALLYLGTAPARAGEVDDALKGLPSPLDALNAAQFGKIAQYAKAYQASGTLLGQTATVFLYWPDPGKLNEPVIAVALPEMLTADKLFGVGSSLDVGLNQPALFWLKKEGVLKKDQMPADLKRRLEAAGMPSSVAATAGFNLFGRLASGFVANLLKPAPVNLDPNNLFVGVAKIAQGYGVTLCIGAGTAWNNPFGLADTSIKGATVHITSDSNGKTVEAWGTANLKSKKDVTLYAKRQGATEQSLGFDLKDASLEDFFLVLSVAGKTLKLPDISTPAKLPLSMVTLANPAYQAYTDAGAPLSFDTMMFKGTQKATGAGELIANAKGKVFNQPVASIALNASASGVKGAADVSVALGTLKASSTKFYLTIGLSGAPSMGLKTDTVLGSMDFKADEKGLQLIVPPKCPTQPLGLHATLTDISPSDIKFTFELEDCATGLIKDGVDAAIEGGQIVLKNADKAGGGAGSAISDAAKAVGDAATDAGKAVAGAATDTGKAAAGAAKDAGSAASGAAKDAGSAASGAAHDAGHAAGRLIKKL